MLEPYLLISSESEHLNESSCLYYSKLKVYWSTKTFITRSIFKDNFANAVITYLDNVRAKYQNPNFEAIIISAYLKGHISLDLFPYCSQAKYSNFRPTTSLISSLATVLPRSIYVKEIPSPKISKNRKKRSIIARKPQKILTICEM